MKDVSSRSLIISKLYIIATPIGNLEDITLRALRILKKADLILCEDTRVAKKLLEHYKISKPCLSYHHHSRLSKINYILDRLKQGKNLALVSDAGTPGISDPGNKLIKQIVEKLDNQVEIIPIPGPSALTAALSASGLLTDKFLFLGFPPSKRKRKKFFEKAVKSKYTVIFYESPHRIIKTLEELNLEFQVTNSKFQMIVCRELTKKFETIYRGGLRQIINQLKQENKIKGEFVVIISSVKK